MIFQKRAHAHIHAHTHTHTHTYTHTHRHRHRHTHLKGKKDYTHTHTHTHSHTHISNAKKISERRKRSCVCEERWEVRFTQVGGVEKEGTEDAICKEMCVAVCCSVLQCVAVCCSVLQCVAVFGEAGEHQR